MKKLKLLIAFIAIALLTGCITLPNNHSIFIEKDNGTEKTFVKHHEIIDQAKVINKEDSFYILLNDIYITENGDWFWDYIGYFPGAEIAVVALIDDGTAVGVGEKEDQKILIHFSKYIDDYSELPFDSIPIYSKTNGDPKYLRIRLQVYDIDKQENEYAMALLEKIGSHAEQVPNQYSQGVALLSEAGQFIVENNPDDMIMEYDFTLVPYMDSVGGQLDKNPVLQQAKYRLIGHDNDFLNPEEISVINDRITRGNSEKSPYPHATFTVVKGDLGIDLATLKRNLNKMFNTLKTEYETESNRIKEILEESLDSGITAAQFMNEFDSKRAKETIPIVAKALSLDLNQKTKNKINAFLKSKLFPSTQTIVEDLNNNETEADWVAFASQYLFALDSNTKKVRVTPNSN